MDMICLIPTQTTTSLASRTHSQNHGKFLPIMGSAHVRCSSMWDYTMRDIANVLFILCYIEI